MPDLLLGNSGMFPNPILNQIVLGIPPDYPSIIDELLPIVSSPLESFDILKVGNDTNMYEEDDLRALGGESNAIDYGFSKTKGYVVERSLKKILDYREIEQARKIGDWFRVSGAATPLTQPEVLATVFVRNRIMKGREVRAAKLIQTGANYPGPNVINAFNAATGDLEASIDTQRSLIKSAIVGVPNTLWVSWDVWQAIKKNPIVRGRIFGTAGGGITKPDIVASLLGVDEILIGSGTYTTKTGNPATYTRVNIWTQTMGLLYKPPSAAAGVPSFGYQFTCPYDGMPTGNTLATGVKYGGAVGGADSVAGYGGAPGQSQLGMSYQESLTELRMAFYYRERQRPQILQPEAGAIWTNVLLA